MNVTGQNVLDPLRRWTRGFRQNVYSSRVNTTRTLADAVEGCAKPPKALITISGVGYYKPSPSAEYTEESPGGDDYFAQLCRDWEEAGRLRPDLPTRRVVRSRAAAVARAACWREPGLLLVS